MFHYKFRNFLICMHCIDFANCYEAAQTLNAYCFTEGKIVVGKRFAEQCINDAGLAAIVAHVLDYTQGVKVK